MNFSFDLNEGFSGFSGFAANTPADGCTQCGICLSACPTFQQTEDVEQSPMGRIRMMRALKSGESEGMALEKLDSCLACYSCESVCPSRVRYGEMLDTALERLREQRAVPRLSKWMLRLSLRPQLLLLLTRLAVVGQWLGVRQLLRGLGLLKVLGLARADALLGQVGFPRTSLENRLHRPRYDQRVSLFRGCFTSVLEQEVQQSAIYLLNALGLEVVIPEGQACCGALHKHSGEGERARLLAHRNVLAFNNVKSRALLTTSSGCGASLQEYDLWLGSESESESEVFEQPVMDVSHFLEQELAARHVVFHPLPLKVALHTPCSLKQKPEQVEAVAALLNRIPGLEVHALAAGPACCGAGGSQMLSQPETADGLRDATLAEVAQLQPDMLISSNLGCAMHLKAGLEKAGLDIPLRHPLQLMEQAMAVEFVGVRSV